MLNYHLVQTVRFLSIRWTVGLNKWITTSEGLSRTRWRNPVSLSVHYQASAVRGTEHCVARVSCKLFFTEQLIHKRKKKKSILLALAPLSEPLPLFPGACCNKLRCVRLRLRVRAPIWWTAWLLDDRRSRLKAGDGFTDGVRTLWEAADVFFLQTVPHRSTFSA